MCLVSELSRTTEGAHGHQASSAKGLERLGPGFPEQQQELCREPQTVGVCSVTRGLWGHRKGHLSPEGTRWTLDGHLNAGAERWGFKSHSSLGQARQLS